MVPVAPSTSMASIPAHLPIPLIRSTAEIVTPLTPYNSWNRSNLVFLPSPHIHIILAGLRPLSLRATLIGWLFRIS